MKTGSWGEYLGPRGIRMGSGRSFSWDERSPGRIFSIKVNTKHIIQIKVITIRYTSLVYSIMFLKFLLKMSQLRWKISRKNILNKSKVNGYYSNYQKYFPGVTYNSNKECWTVERRLWIKQVNSYSKIHLLLFLSNSYLFILIIQLIFSLLLA